MDVFVYVCVESQVDVTKEYFSHLSPKSNVFWCPSNSLILCVLTACLLTETRFPKRDWGTTQPDSILNRSSFIHSSSLVHICMTIIILIANVLSMLLYTCGMVLPYSSDSQPVTYSYPKEYSSAIPWAYKVMWRSSTILKQIYVCRKKHVSIYWVSYNSKGYMVEKCS